MIYSEDKSIEKEEVYFQNNDFRIIIKTTQKQNGNSYCYEIKTINEKLVNNQWVDIEKLDELKTYS